MRSFMKLELGFGGSIYASLATVFVFSQCAPYGTLLILDEFDFAGSRGRRLDNNLTIFTVIVKLNWCGQIPR